MPHSKVYSAAFYGLDALPVEVEVDASRQERSFFVIVGLPDTAVKESKDRVLTALKNASISIQGACCTVNLAPGNIKKEGVLYDLPIALGLLQALQIIPCTSPVQDYLVVGELALDASTRPIQGALALALLAKKMGKKGVLIPEENAAEAAIVPDLPIYPIRHLKELVSFFQMASDKESFRYQPLKKQEETALHNPSYVDFSDVKGHSYAKRALEIAAAGAHNVLLYGPPGSGKTLLAKALQGILPDMNMEEALESTKIHSVAGMLPKGLSLLSQRPFRSPHHTISYAGLIGGGSVPRPGEVSLAHHGILFLDELPEFSRQALKVLRQPLEDKKVTISRAQGNFCFPTHFLLVAAMNPCPCGYLGHPDRSCRDTELQVQRYRGKISGPLWDRFDLHIEVPALRYQELLQAPHSENSAIIRSRVEQARLLQRHRLSATRTNSTLSPKEIRIYAPLTDESQDLIRQAVDTLSLSARGCDRVLKVARTIADLEGAEIITYDHVAEALSFRKPDTQQHSGT